MARYITGCRVWGIVTQIGRFRETRRGRDPHDQARANELEDILKKKNSNQKGRASETAEPDAPCSKCRQITATELNAGALLDAIHRCCPTDRSSPPSVFVSVVALRGLFFFFDSRESKGVRVFRGSVVTGPVRHACLILDSPGGVGSSLSMSWLSVADGDVVDPPMIDNGDGSTWGDRCSLA